LSPADAGLRGEFHRRCGPGWQWSAVESGGSSPGIPDSEYCSPEGEQGWIEFKATHAWAVKFRPLQVSWIDRRSRLGGRVLVGVRRIVPARRRAAAVDELWLVEGGLVRTLATEGLRGLNDVLGRWGGGPGGWDWGAVRRVLRGSA
jgi:hypothetical protein